MLRKPLNPEEQATANRWLLVNLAGYLSIALITVTGIVKALRYLYPIPGPVLFWASTLHVAAMVLIGLKVLDQLRIVLERDRRVALAVVALLWSLASVAVAYFFVTSAFVAKTAAKEGILSQLALLFGGLAIAALAFLVLRECVRIVTGRPAPARTAGGPAADLLGERPIR